MTELEHEHAQQIHQDTPAAPTDGAPVKAHGDPLLAASSGATEGTEGTRHGVHDPGD